MRKFLNKYFSGADTISFPKMAKYFLVALVIGIFGLATDRPAVYFAGMITFFLLICSFIYLSNE